MLVKDLMTKNPITAPPDMSFNAAWELIFKKRISGLPIIDSHRYILGIVSKEDLISRLYPSYTEFITDSLRARKLNDLSDKIASVSHLTVSDIMNKDVITTKGAISILKAGSKMLLNRVSCLPVVKPHHGKDKLIGMICKGDIFSAVFKKYMTSKTKTERQHE